MRDWPEFSVWPGHSAATLRRLHETFPVNGDRSFTGNCRSFAEYRVSTCTITLKIPPSKET
jgi:hypothetical protein